MKKTMQCVCCGRISLLKKNTQNKYCDNTCQQRHQNVKLREDWLSGKLLGYTGKAKQLKKFVRSYLHEIRGTACSLCGWDERHPLDGSVLTEIDHIDGNAENCTLENLRILCPNCHSMTPTFRARNKKSSRSR
jgi:hypothetical protein